MRWRRKPAAGPQPASADPLSSPERKHRLDRIHQQTSLPLWSFEQLYLTPLRRYAALLERQPTRDETELEGPLDKSLGLIESALMLRRSRLLPPGAAPEEQAQQTEAWSVALVYALLLEGLSGLPEACVTGSEAAYAQLVDRDILDWLRAFPEVWDGLLAVAAGQRHMAGTLGELLGRTYQTLESRSAWQDNRSPQEPSEAIAEQSMPANDKAIPTDCLGQAFLSWLKNLIAQQQLVVNQADALVHVIDGQAFLCSPAIFQGYCKDREEVLGEGGFDEPDWRAVQRGFEALRIHRERPDGRSIWTYEQAWPGQKSRRLYGYLMDAKRLLESAPATAQSLVLDTCNSGGPAGKGQSMG